MNRALFAIIGVLFLAVAGVGIYGLTQGKSVGDSYGAVTNVGPAENGGTDDDRDIESGENEGDDDASPTQTADASSAGGKTFTLADVAAHNTQEDCYTAVNGNVYDLTPFISSHPGGVRNIMRICGKDGTTEFETQHGGRGRPEQMLASLKIGVLK